MTTQISQNDLKKIAARHAIDRISDGMTVGIGSGSTVAFAIKELGRRVAAGLNARILVASEASGSLAKSCGIEVVTFQDVDRLDLAIDGADEVDPHFNLIKGGGGALLREKVVIHAARETIIMVDQSKVVEQLGRFPLPIEVVPYALLPVKRELQSMGFTPEPRQQGDGGLYTTDNGNYILDTGCFPIKEPAVLDAALRHIPGIVEVGLFYGMVNHVIVAGETGVTVREAKG